MFRSLTLFWYLGTTVLDVWTPSSSILCHECINIVSRVAGQGRSYTAKWGLLAIKLFSLGGYTKHCHSSILFMEWFLGEQHFPACKIAVSLVEISKQVLPWPSFLPPHPPGWWVKHGDSTENWLTSVEGHNPREKVPFGSTSNLSSKLASLKKATGFWARTSRNHHQWDFSVYCSFVYPRHIPLQTSSSLAYKSVDNAAKLP